MEIRQTLIPGSTYHVCTRSNGDDLLFRDHDDYTYFKQSMFERLSNAWEILAWNFVPNELHLIIRIKDVETEKPIRHAHLFGNVLNGYVQHYNRKYFRQGSLLNRSFRRKLIRSQDEMKDLICMIDNLPVARGLVNDCSEWKHGSYFEFNKTNFFTDAAKKVIEKFTNVMDYITHHVRDGLMKYNILPPRKWLSRWTPINYFEYGDNNSSPEPPFG